MAKEKVKEQISLFDTIDTYNGGFVIDNCKLNKSDKIWCKNWNGKGDISIVKKDMNCPKNITKENTDKCKFYVVGTPCKNFRNKK